MRNLDIRKIEKLTPYNTKTRPFVVSGSYNNTFGGSAEHMCECEVSSLMLLREMKINAVALYVDIFNNTTGFYLPPNSFAYDAYIAPDNGVIIGSQGFSGSGTIEKLARIQSGMTELNLTIDCNLPPSDILFFVRAILKAPSAFATYEANMHFTVYGEYSI